MGNKRNTSAAQIPLPSAESRTQTLGTLDIDPALVIVREGWNVRRKFDAKAITELAGSIARNGQLDAISVVDSTAEERAKYLPDVAEGVQVFTLIQGERRLRAVRQLKAPTIRASIFARGIEDAANAEGNVHREDLAYWERCEAITESLARGESRDTLAKRWRLSPQSISIAKGVKEGLIPEIWAAFKRFPTASKFAMENYRKTPEEQKAAWAEWLRVQDEKASAPAGKRRKKSSKGKGEAETDGGGSTRPSKAEATAVMDNLAAAVEQGPAGRSEAASLAWIAGALYGLRHSMGVGIPRGQTMPAEVRKILTRARKADAAQEAANAEDDAAE